MSEKAPAACPKLTRPEPQLIVVTHSNLSHLVKGERFLMRAVIQRVTRSSVEVDSKIVGSIAAGMLVLLGVEKGDQQSDFDYIANKTLGLRIFDDDDGRMNLSAQQVDAEILVVSQFTLLGDVRRGKRPAFTSAEDPTIAKATWLKLISHLREQGLRVEAGTFAADMQVSLVNDGPVTILLDSRKTF